MTEQERAAHDAAKHERAARAAEKQLDAVLGWLERAHPLVLTELIDACRGVLQRGSGFESRMDPAPGLIRRRTRNGEHVVTLRELTESEKAMHNEVSVAPFNERVYAYAAVACDPPCSDITVDGSSPGLFTEDFFYTRIFAQDAFDLTEPA